MLLLVDSVNVLGNVITNLISGNFEVLQDEVKVRYLKIIGVFTAGSAFGLVSISHVLGYVLKRWHQIVTAVIIGFITGSLGVVWPWKETVYKKSSGEFLLDQIIFYVWNHQEISLLYILFVRVQELDSYFLLRYLE